MPNIENLRKQAKQILRWHQAGYTPVAAQIRSVLARFGGRTDREVLAAGFKLSDAQELVARRNGFESWAALIQEIDAMPMKTGRNLETEQNRKTEPDQGAATVVAAEPMVFVSDLGKALSFYGDSLGFAAVFSYGEPPFYAQVARGGARLNLRRVGGPVFDAAFRSREADALSAVVTLSDAKALFLEFQAADVPLHQALRTEPWGARTFIVRDPDDNLICFAGPA